MRLPSLPILFCSLVGLGLLPATAGATEPTPGYHPWAPAVGRVRTIDMRAAVRAGPVDRVARPAQPDIHALDQLMTPDAASDDAGDHGEPAVDPSLAGRTPEGWVQAGGVVLPAPIAAGDAVVDPDVIYAIEDVPGNEYPRKHTLFLNFSGGMLSTGADNSAESKSILAKQGVYPAYTGGEQKAVSAAQAIENDVAAYGIRVMYLERPPKIVPYTMEMIGGQWTDTNIDSPAGGVAPGADCGALGQRHVVYTFASGGTSATQIANTASQEAGHAWGLDHTFNCSSVMSYCGGGDGSFSTACDPLCEAQCQGANTAGCRLTHEVFCGEGNDQQNEQAELSWLFGGNEPDVEPPFAEIVSPEDGATFEEGASVDLRAMIGDNYGGYGWQWTIERDGEVIFDEVAYEREVDDEYRPAVNLSMLDAGVWTMTITVQDQFENVAQHSVTIVVGDGELPADTGDPTGDGTSAIGVDTGDSSEGDGTGVPGLDDTGGDPGKDSCACGTRPRPSPHEIFVLFTLFAVRRRRL